MAIRRPLDHLFGQRFGRWLVLREVPPPTNTPYQRCLECRCDCGRVVPVNAINLKRGVSRSCGCLRNELGLTRSVTHGLSRSPEYKAWAQIKVRCFDSNNPGFRNYGGRGIGMDAAWRDSFPAFYAALGPRPSRYHSLDRLDNERGYEPGNVEWATRKQQANNTRRNRRLTVNGETRTLSAWAERVGITPHSLLHRLSRGWNLEEAVKTATLSDSTRRTNRYLTLHGDTLTVTDWAKRAGMQVGTVLARLRMGWSAERALSEPVKLGRHGPLRRPL